MTQLEVTKKIGVGINTRDRWNDLAETLERLTSYDRPRISEIIVIDDGSVEPCPRELQERFPGVTFHRDEKSRGLPAQRNRLAHLLKSDYYLCVDDDSFPIAGALDEAMAYMQSRPEVFCLAFDIIHNESQLATLKVEEPRQVKSFIGCAHLVDIAKFKLIGGYREELFFFNEEEELSARAWKRNWPVIYFPKVTICHRKNPTQAHRRSSKRAFYFARGKMLMVLWTVPAVQLPYRALAAPLGCLKLERKADWLVSLCGSLKGLWDGLSLLHYRDPLSLQTYRRYREATWPTVG